jgi:hypothetical protein
MIRTIGMELLSSETMITPGIAGGITMTSQVR